MSTKGRVPLGGTLSTGIDVIARSQSPAIATTRFGGGGKEVKQWSGVHVFTHDSDSGDRRRTRSGTNKHDMIEYMCLYIYCTYIYGVRAGHKTP